MFGKPAQSDPGLVFRHLKLVGGDSNYRIRYKGLLQEPWQEMGVIKLGGLGGSVGAAETTDTSTL